MNPFFRNRIWNTGEVLKCEHCTYRSSSQSALTHHLFSCRSVPSEARLYRCLICRLSFPCKQQVDIHHIFLFYSHLLHLPFVCLPSLFHCISNFTNSLSSIMNSLLEIVSRNCIYIHLILYSFILKFKYIQWRPKES